MTDLPQRLRELDKKRTKGPLTAHDPLGYITLCPEGDWQHPIAEFTNHCERRHNRDFIKELWNAWTSGELVLKGEALESNAAEIERLRADLKGGAGLKAVGASRDAGEPKSLLIAFNRRPTDDELRAVHNFLRRNPARCPFCNTPSYACPCTQCGCEHGFPVAKMHADVIEALTQALEYFENREDVVDGSYGEPSPNREMTLAQLCRDALCRLDRC